MAWPRAKPLSRCWAAVLCAALCTLAVCRSSAQPAEDRSADGCLRCHLAAAERRLREPAQLLHASVHTSAQIGCADCHGGDPTAETVSAHAVDAGFVGKLTGIAALERCGDCHADGARIGPFAPTLALAARDELLGSRHGLLLAAGDESAPSCADCHGSHDTRAGSDTRSQVARGRVAETCGRCHADPGRLAGHRLATTQLHRWRGSAHGIGLARGNPLAPSCTGCHGAHADAMAGEGSARARCVSCHPAAAAYLERGPHAAVQRARGLDPCLSCHDPHDAPIGSWHLLGLGAGSSCGRCHDGKDASYQAITDLTVAVRAARARARGARVAIQEAIEAGSFVSPGVIVRLEAAELLLRPRIHGCELDPLRPMLAELEAAAASVQAEASVASSPRRLLGWGAAPAGITLAAGVLALFGLGAVRGRRARRGGQEGA